MIPLADVDGVRLVALARAAVVSYVRRTPLPSVTDVSDGLVDPRDVFVTVEAPPGTLRGCLGSMGGDESIAAEVVRLAGEAATSDTRFPPLAFSDLEAFTVKVSVLGPRIPLVASSPDDLCARLRPGTDGVVLELPPPGSRALFLPEVWAKVENDPGVFLGALSEKQGAPASAWRDRFSEARVSIFQTWVFGA
ncbi:MAG: AmmeMemoRadiSam system protein A [Planctomycetes bacterium]|nr:AmmeMemoRadiSam system protein A [Planctomycetota bacterium]